MNKDTLITLALILLTVWIILALPMPGPAGDLERRVQRLEALLLPTPTPTPARTYGTTYML